MDMTNFTPEAMSGAGNVAAPYTSDVLLGLAPTPCCVQDQVGGGASLLNMPSFAARHTALIKSEAVNTGPAMNQAIVQLAKQIGTSPIPAPPSSAGHDFCWGTERFQGRVVVGHGGGTLGFTANVSLIPSLRSVVVLVNRKHADPLIKAIGWHAFQALNGAQPPQDTGALLRLLGQRAVPHP